MEQNKLKVGVIGAGTMGAGIAQVASTSGHKVVLFDKDQKVLTKAKTNLEKILNRLIEKGKIDQPRKNEILNNISYSNTLEDFKDTGFVIEAIVENLEIKKSVFAALEEIVTEDTILATNTSSLSVTSIAAACKQAQRVIGIHFFNPAPLMPLVEIIPCVQTAEGVLTKSRTLIDSWGKVTAIAKDTPGFIVNRVARPFYGEAIRILEEGIADTATIDWAMKEIGGFRMGPFELMDYIGNDVNYVVTETVFKAFYYDPRYRPSFTQKRLVEAGWLGRKSGKGYYNYENEHVKVGSKKDLEKGQGIFLRILSMLINEAADALYLNIASLQEIDLAMTKGVNYPKGLLLWADEIGIPKVLGYLEALQAEYGEERYRPSPMLRKMVREQKNFY